MKNKIFYALVFGAVCTSDVGAVESKPQDKWPTLGGLIKNRVANEAPEIQGPTVKWVGTGPEVKLLDMLDLDYETSAPQKLDLVQRSADSSSQSDINQSADSSNQSGIMIMTVSNINQSAWASTQLDESASAFQDSRLIGHSEIQHYNNSSFDSSDDDLPPHAKLNMKDSNIHQDHDKKIARDMDDLFSSTNPDDELSNFNLGKSITIEEHKTKENTEKRSSRSDIQEERKE